MSNYKCNYQPSWSTVQILKNWIAPVKDDSQNAYCRFCCITLRAHKSDLTKHATAINHLKKAEEKEQCDSTCPSFRKIVAYRDDQGKLKEEGDCSASAGEANGLVHCKPLMEHIIDFKGWTRSSGKDGTRVFCIPCKMDVCSNYPCLLIHSDKTGHKEKLRAMPGSSIHKGRQSVNEIGNADAEMKLPSYEEAIDNSQNRCSGMEIDIKYCPFASTGQMGSVPDDYPMLSDVPMSCDVSLGQSVKRQKMDSQDVLDAIGDGDFDAEDLLRIAKTAIENVL